MDEQIWNPIDLIDFKIELKKSIEFVFGDKIICSSIAVAKEIAFNPNIRRICITKKGDVINPSGLLEGGFLAENNRFLPRAIWFWELTVEIERINRQHEELQKELNIAIENNDLLKKQKEQFNELTKEIEDIKTKLNYCNSIEINTKIEIL